MNADKKRTYCPAQREPSQRFWICPWNLVHFEAVTLVHKNDRFNRLQVRRHLSSWTLSRSVSRCKISNSAKETPAGDITILASQLHFTLTTEGTVMNGPCATCEPHQCREPRLFEWDSPHNKTANPSSMPLLQSAPNSATMSDVVKHHVTCARYTRQKTTQNMQFFSTIHASQR